jgi:hypothetical protein
MNTDYYRPVLGRSRSDIPPSQWQSAVASSIVVSLTGTISSSLHAMKESDIKPKSASVKSLVFILNKF